MTKFTFTDALPEDIAQQLHTFHPLVQNILFRAGITTTHEAKKFLAPDYAALSNPALFADMEIATARLVSALKKGEHIGIYADYDADGIPGACVIYNTLRACNVSEEKITVYIPHRHYEGYGVHRKAVEELRAKGVDLLITVDVGITEYETLSWLQSQGVDVILTDHHEMPSQIPEVLAVIHPARDPYPDAKLCGAAVAFQLTRGLLEGLRDAPDLPDTLRVPHVGWEKWLLDLVGLATLSDMVPLIGENRILAWFGMQVLKKTRNHGLRALIAQQRIRTQLMTEDDVVFSITPRLNAASRMDHPERAFELLQSENEQEALDRAQHLESLNRKRKTTVARIMKIVHDRLGKRTRLPSIVVVGERTWEQGVLGLIASKITEAYGVTAFVWSEQSDGIIKGSCRSANGVHLVELMRAVPENTWEHFGGHAGAGGFALRVEQILQLEQILNTALAEKNSEICIANEEKVTLDSILSPSEITPMLYATLRSCAPFGVGNPAPVVAIKGSIKDVSMFGKGKEHVKVIVHDHKGNNIEAIAFFTQLEDFSFALSTHESKNDPQKEIYVIGSIEQSTFGYKKQLRIRIIDITESLGEKS
ncbi:single-stranded-DNA-specific exonuclease RecJ [Candidatus Nomurabacteria bacterium]|nr:single-stranded-DNA-specific exonuclease RecJ [Candidatus Nomurabacteria bacterium]